MAPKTGIIVFCITDGTSHFWRILAALVYDLGLQAGGMASRKLVPARVVTKTSVLERLWLFFFPMLAPSQHIAYQGGQIDISRLQQRNQRGLEQSCKHVSPRSFEGGLAQNLRLMWLRLVVDSPEQDCTYPTASRLEYGRSCPSEIVGLRIVRIL